MYRFRDLVIFSLIMGTASCGKLPGFSVSEKSDTFQQAAVRNDKIDVLFIVDNSGSMADNQANLASSFSNFIDKFTAQNLNFHIGVISTDAYSVHSYWTNHPGVYAAFQQSVAGPFSLQSGDLLSKIGNDIYLTKDSVNPTLQFTQNASIGTTGSGAETGLLSATNFFDSTLQSGWNNGFLRPEAYLSMIVVSDEDESLSDTNSSYVKTDDTAKATRVNNFLAAARGVKTTANQSRIRFDAVVSRSRAECPSMPANPSGLAKNEPVGTTYMEVASTLKGITSNICTDFSGDIAQIGADLVAATTSFHLLQPPVGGADGITVSVNGTVVPQDATNGWTYDSTTQDVTFHGTSVPPVNAQISVNYVPSKPI